MEYGLCNPLKFTLITNPYDVTFETDIINRLFREGLDELHLRKPDYTKDDYMEFIERIDPEHHSKLVLHSYYTLVHNYDIRKIHLNYNWRKNPAMRFFLNQAVLLGKKIRKSTTVNNYKSLYAAKPGIDELIMGPVFSKISNSINNQLVKTETLEKALSHSKVPVIGLGGVGADTLGFFKSVGFDGIALQSSIWRSMDPIKAFIEVRDYDMQVETRLRKAA